MRLVVCGEDRGVFPGPTRGRLASRALFTAKGKTNRGWAIQADNRVVLSPAEGVQDGAGDASLGVAASKRCKYTVKRGTVSLASQTKNSNRFVLGIE